jgi:dTDP-4-dehydrorhamnose 3,5-epimerase
MGRPVCRADSTTGHPAVKFTATPIPGVFIIDIAPHQDERGFFARTVCMEEFAQHGLDGHFVQQSLSWNPNAGTLRGLHYQAAPHEEAKLVRVTRGILFDVIADLRQGSAFFGQWFSIELSADNRRQLYIPAGVAHGFQTLLPNTEILYEMTVPFHAEACCGVRWDDPVLGIVWPEFNHRIISEKDRALPILK